MGRQQISCVAREEGRALTKRRKSRLLTYGFLGVLVIALSSCNAFLIYWRMAHPNRWPGWHCQMRSGFCYRIPANSK